MTQNLDDLFANNRQWAENIRAEDPLFFERLANIQSPEYLWIGCSDSRVPANQITGLLPGEVFVHRNIANLVVHSDLNCLSVLQFAVDSLKVKHVLVVGHYGCGGVRASLEQTRHGLVDNWLRHVQDVREKHRKFLSQISDANTRLRRMCELNVAEQVFNLCHTTVVRDAWERNQALTVHGWVYDIADGILHDIQLSTATHEDTHRAYDAAIESIYAGKI